MQKEIAEYLNHVTVRNRRAAKVYELHIRRFSSFCPKGITRVKQSDVDHWQVLLSKKYSEQTVALAIIALRGFFKYWGRRKKLALFHDEIKTPRITARPYYALKPDEFEKIDSLFSDFDFYHLQIKVIFRLLWSGLRVSEVRALNLSDIDPTNQYTRIITKKSLQWDYIFWGKDTHQLLLKLIGIRTELDRNPWLFISPMPGHPRITCRTIERWVKLFSKRAGITGQVVPHSFRHGLAHSIIASGGSVKDVQMLLRHSKDNPQASFRYLHLDITEAKARAEKFIHR